MKKNLTEIVFILDRSGSMYGLENDTIGGYNSMLADQRKAEGEALISTVLFANDVSVIHDRVPIDKVKDITNREYFTGGMTAMLDAIGEAIHHIGIIHKYARSEDVPEKTLFIITTDGMENASHKYTYDNVRRMIERQKTKYGWEFLFLGANIDSAAMGGKIGIDRDFTVDYTNDGEGTRLNYKVMSNAISQVRSCKAPIDRNWKSQIVSERKKRK